MIDTIAFNDTERSDRVAMLEIKEDDMSLPADRARKSKVSHSLPMIDPLLVFKMGLVSLAKFGALDDFLKWVRS